MNYVDIINQVVAEAVDREVENRLAAKNGEIASLKEFLAGRDKEIADLKDQVEKKDKELVALRGDVLERGSRIESLQAELNGVRGALKNHVDSEESLRKDLEKACDLDALVDEKETEIERLNGVIEEKDELIAKYKDMADAISDWTTNDMPSLDPDDY